MKKKKKQTLIFIFCIVGFLLLMVLYFLYTKYIENYNYLKIDRSKYLVYTVSKTQNGVYYQYKPYVNIKGVVGKSINENIDNYMNDFNNDNIGITYEYDLSGSILSLIIKIEDHSLVESANSLSFRSYNVNLETLEILSNEQILDYYNMSSNNLDNILNNKINDYYNSLVSNNIISKTCDYNCFINSWNFDTNNDDIEYFIRDSKLIIFKPYIIISSIPQENIKYDFEIIG